MVTGQELRRLRLGAEIPSALVAERAGINRARLSMLERGVEPPRGGELERVKEALDVLIQARERVAALAAEVGYPI